MIFSFNAYAADFTIVDGQTVTATQFLNNGEVGTIENGGTISTTSGSAVQSNDSVTITNNGTLNTSDAGARGVLAFGSDTKVSNTGNIITTGNSSAEGIRTIGDNSSIISSGSVSTSGSNGFVISATGQNSSITNSGTVTATGSGAHGLHSNGLNNTISNSGTVSASGSSSNGIFSQANNGTIINSGTVSKSDSGNAITAIGQNSSITNSGNVFTTNASSYALHSSGSNNTILNSGNASTSGTSAHAINSTASNATITNSGTLSVSGTGAIGLNSTGADGIINLSGKISATGNATQAILGSNNQTLNIYPGAEVVGTIDLGGGTNSVNIYSGKQPTSSTMTITNGGTINLDGSNAGIAISNGNTVALVDPTGYSASSALLNVSTTQIHRSVNQQVARYDGFKPVQLASLEPLSGNLLDSKERSAWVQAYGQHVDGSADGSISAYSSDLAGGVIGFDTFVDDVLVGIFFGRDSSEVNTDAVSTEIQTNSDYLGGYWHTKVNNWGIVGTVSAGRSHHKGKRSVVDNLNGSEEASSDFDSYYISPSLTINNIIEFGDGIYMKPSFGSSYTYAVFDNYIETGTTQSNLHIGRRSIDTASAEIQLSGGKRFNDSLTIEARMAADYSYFGNDPIDVSLNGGTSSRFNNIGPTDELQLSIGVSSSYEINNEQYYFLDLDYGTVPSQKKTYSALIGAQWIF